VSSSVQIHPLMRVPPPLLFVLTFFAGVGLQHLLPFPAPSAEVAHVARIAGTGLLACGILLALSCITLFLLVRTTIIPHRTASKLVNRGPYRLTRNPMYVSLVLAFLGVAGILALLWPILLLPVPVALVHRMVIPFEEARLRDAFGDDFESYCARVRRWL
jgi:protein-S-isoprenylcysteine O-methyltransferase Ste14